MNPTTIIVGNVRMTQIARFLGQEGDKKVAINAKGQQFFIPEGLRDNIEEGDFVILVGKEYTSQGIDPATGQLKIDDQGNPVYDGEKFLREDVLKAGDYDTITADFYADDVLESAKAQRVKQLATAFMVAPKGAPRKEVVLKD